MGSYLKVTTGYATSPDLVALYYSWGYIIATIYKQKAALTAIFCIYVIDKYFFPSFEIEYL